MSKPWSHGSLRGCVALLLVLTAGNFVRGKQTAGLPVFGMFLDLKSYSTPAQIDQAVDRAAALGAQRIRTIIPWAAVEPSPGQFDFDRYDDLAQSARRRGMGMVFSLGFCPPWAAGDTDDSPDARMRMMPAKLSDWTHYVSAVVSRYKGEVRYWQIWEAPSIENFRGSDDDYFELLKAAHEAARKADPNAFVLASDPGGPDLGFIARLFHKDLIHSFEGLALAPRVEQPEDLDEYIRAIRGRLFAKHPASPKFLFITDWDYPADSAQRAQAAAAAAHVDSFFSTSFSEARPPPLSSEKPVSAEHAASAYPVAGPACVDFLLEGEVERGLYTRKYRHRRMANPITTLHDRVPAARLTDTNPFLYVDVDDRYIFFNEEHFPIEVAVKAAALDPRREAGFNLMYDSPAGWVFSRWVKIRAAAGWNTYKIILRDANFAEKADLIFESAPWEAAKIFSFLPSASAKNNPPVPKDRRAFIPVRH